MVTGGTRTSRKRDGNVMERDGADESGIISGRSVTDAVLPIYQ